MFGYNKVKINKKFHYVKINSDFKKSLKKLVESIYGETLFTLSINKCNIKMNDAPLKIKNDQKIEIKVIHDVLKIQFTIFFKKVIIKLSIEYKQN